MSVVGLIVSVEGRLARVRRAFIRCSGGAGEGPEWRETPQI
jgi:hypothetical protein